MKAEDSTDMLVQDQRGGTVMKRLITLLAAVTAVIMLAQPGFAQSSFTWNISCNGSANGGASWAWLYNGAQISSAFGPPNGEIGCIGTQGFSGTALIPTSIVVNGINIPVNGILVSVSVSTSPGVCSGWATVTKSFDPSAPKILIDENVSPPGQIDYFGSKVKCSPGSIRFSLRS
jgi:hypothetical protein